MMPRGQGKSTLVAALYDLMLGEEGSTVVAAPLPFFHEPEKQLGDEPLQSGVADGTLSAWRVFPRLSALLVVIRNFRISPHPMTPGWAVSSLTGQLGAWPG